MMPLCFAVNYLICCKHLANLYHLGLMAHQQCKSVILARSCMYDRIFAGLIYAWPLCGVRMMLECIYQECSSWRSYFCGVGFCFVLVFFASSDSPIWGHIIYQDWFVYMWFWKISMNNRKMHQVLAKVAMSETRQRKPAHYCLFVISYKQVSDFSEHGISFFGFFFFSWNYELVFLFVSVCMYVMYWVMTDFSFFLPWILMLPCFVALPHVTEETGL